jgi:HSP20 family protein
MTSLEQRDRRATESPWNRLDRLFDEWIRSQPVRRLLGAEASGDEIIRVDEYRDGDTQLIRAELPGIDPDNDVQLTVANGMLRINAQRSLEEKTEGRGYVRHELRYGRFTRSLPLAEGATEDDIAATYKDGVLEIRVPVSHEPAQTEQKTIAVSHD